MLETKDISNCFRMNLCLFIANEQVSLGVGKNINGILKNSMQFVSEVPMLNETKSISVTVGQYFSRSPQTSLSCRYTRGGSTSENFYIFFRNFVSNIFSSICSPFFSFSDYFITGTVCKLEALEQ